LARLQPSDKHLPSAAPEPLDLRRPLLALRAEAASALLRRKGAALGRQRRRGVEAALERWLRAAEAALGRRRRVPVPLAERQHTVRPLAARRVRLPVPSERRRRKARPLAEQARLRVVEVSVAWEGRSGCRLSRRNKAPASEVSARRISSSSSSSSSQSRIWRSRR